MIKLYNQKEQKWYDVPTNEAPARLSEGWVGEAGVDYPVVNPDGKTVLIPAEDLNNAVTQGYRFTTNADLDRNIEAEQKKIREQAFGDPLAAGVTEFGSQGLLGIPDAIARAGEELGVDSLQGFTEARKAQRELSPTATMIGGVASAFIPGGGLVGAASKGAKSLAASKGLGSLGQLAAEGAVLGVGPGLTEASLGKPEDVAETLIASGMLGGILNVASPYAINGLRKIGEEGTSATQRLVDYAAKKTMGLAVPVNKALGNTEESALIREVLDLSPEARRAIADRPEFVKEITSETDAAIKAVKKETDKLTSDLKSAIKNMPEDLQASFQQTLKENANNLTAALDDSYNRYRELDASFNELIGGLTGPGKVAGPLFAKSTEAVQALGKSANPRVKQAAEAIREQLDSYGLSKFEGMLKADSERAVEATLGQVLTEGQEIALARTIKRDLNRTASRLMSSDTGAAKLVSKFAEEIDNIGFKGHVNPFVQDSAREMDRLYKPLAEMRKAFLGKSGTFGAKTATGKQIDRLFVDPEFRSKFENNIEILIDQFPALARIAGEVEGSSAQKAVINDLKSAILQKTNDPNNLAGRLDSDDLVELARTMTGIEPRYGKAKAIKDAGSRLESLKTVQDQIQAAPNAFDKLLIVKKAQGLPITSDLQEMGKYYNIMDKLATISKSSEGSGLLDRVMKRPGALGIGLGIGAGMLAQDPLTGLSAAVAGSAITRNPAQVLKRLAAVEKATQKFKTVLNKAIVGASDSFVRAGIQQAVRTNAKSKETPKRKYEKTVTFLGEMSSPDKLSEQIANMTGSALTEVAPGVQMAVGTQYAKTVSFLQSKMPQDPLAGKSLFYNKTGYQPPDSQIASFLRYVNAAENPVSVVDSIRKGDVTKEEVDTLKAVYPGLYQTLQESITNAIIDHGDQIPYKRRLILGTMFNVPADPTLDPAFINQMQMTGTPGTQQGRPQGAQDSAPRPSRLQLSDDSLGASQTDRVTYK